VECQVTGYLLVIINLLLIFSAPVNLLHYWFME